MLCPATVANYFAVEPESQEPLRHPDLLKNNSRKLAFPCLAGFIGVFFGGVVMIALIKANYKTETTAARTSSTASLNNLDEEHAQSLYNLLPYDQSGQLVEENEVNIAYGFHNLMSKYETPDHGDVFNCTLFDSGPFRKHHDTRKCLVVRGTWFGNLDWEYCTGERNQDWILCTHSMNSKGEAETFTIRHAKTGGAIQMASQPREPIETHAFKPGDKRQIWRFDYDSRTFKFRGVQQPIHGSLVHAASGKYVCAEIHNRRWVICHYPQTWFMFSRGRVLGDGMLVNMKSHQVLDLHGENHINVAMWPEHGGSNQVWTLFENGEIVSAFNNKCLRATAGLHFQGEGAGNLEVSDCLCGEDQLFHPKPFGDSSFMLVNVKSGYCVDIAGYHGHGNAGVYHCEHIPDQAWSWRSNRPWQLSGDWKVIGCSNNKFSYKVSTSVTGSKTLSKSATATITQEMNAGIELEAVNFGMSQSISLSTTVTGSFTEAVQNAKDLTATCDRHCLYQFIVKLDTKNDFKWNTKRFWCSDSEPQCQPLKQSRPMWCYTKNSSYSEVQLK